MKFICALLLALMVTGGLAAEGYYEAELDGQNQIPPLTTSTYGRATFTPAQGGKYYDWELWVYDVEDMTMAHIHLVSASKGQEWVVGRSKPKLPLIAGATDERRLECSSFTMMCEVPIPDTPPELPFPPGQRNHGERAGHCRPGPRRRFGVGFR